jgi:chromosome segregation protein
VLQTRAGISDTEKAARELRAARDEAARALAALDTRLAEIAARQDAIHERLADEHGATLDDAGAELDALQAEELFQPDTARAEVPRLREQIRGLGAINALALESYEEEQARLTFLQAQRADLAGAEDSLRTTIREINDTARRRFDETFAQIREAFQRLFVDLFGADAAADLALDGDDPLEAPVVISARPSGKRPVSLAQLSGGEKTLTATALLFAIYLVKPSPFCILDEVDAPLDDTNVGRMCELLKTYARDTQFLVITHNKITMALADTIYGVTMQEPGVSKVVSVKFQEAEEQGLVGATAG